MRDLAALMGSDDCPDGYATTRTDEGFDVVNGSEAAVVRCPKILKPIAEIKTAFGKRLRQALMDGGQIEN